MVAFFIMSTILIASFGLLIGLFGLYVSDSKVRDEYAEARTLAEMFEASEKEENSGFLRILSDAGNVYIITDDGGNIIREHGRNTCDLTGGGVIDILGMDEASKEDAGDTVKNELEDELRQQLEDGLSDADVHMPHDQGIVSHALGNTINVYPDTENRIIVPGAQKRIGFDVNKILHEIKTKLFGSDGSLAADGFLTFPYWLEVPLSNGRHMIVRSDFTIYFREVMILTFMALAVAILTIVMLIFAVVFFANNIHKRKKLTEVFFMDEVTGKHNWLWFITNAESTLRARKNAANKYAVLDIVFVNYRNFCVCHSVGEGEEMLRRVDEVIRGNITKRELAAHHSAAHFAAMLRYDDRDALEQRIRKMISELEVINSDHKFSFWVGVDRIGASVDEKGRTVTRKNPNIEIEYNNAGAARATISGDDSAIAFFDEKMVQEQKWMDMIHENQQKALDNEEFVVYYQPKYDPKTEKLKGAEALIRWMSEEHGMISPGKFIPIFENNGFITEIDHYMLRHVAADQRRWLDAGFNCVPVSVNVSRAHFIESDLAEQIRDVVDDAGTPHELIEIELTESAFFDDKKALITTIERLKGYGFTVSMDDFGSGYSSLNSLKEIPLDVLKLDADFFRNDDGTGRGQIVVSEAIDLAKKLNMKTVAEGVEARDQVEFLAEQGCDMIQGFVFDKPMPGSEFEAKMK